MAIKRGGGSWRKICGGGVAYGMWRSNSISAQRNVNGGNKASAALGAARKA